MKKHVLVVDGNSILHANHNGTVLTVSGMQVQGVFGFLRSMRKLMNTMPGQKELIVLWDGRAQFRFDLYPEYKSNRDSADAKSIAHKEAFRKQLPYIKAALTLLGIRQIRCEHLEADDLAGMLVKKLGESVEITLVTGDQDWIQAVTDNVTWFDPIRDRTVTPANLLDFTGYHTTQAFVEGKALMGDSSDTVPGVGGIGKEGAPLFLAQYGSVYTFFSRYNTMDLKKMPKARLRLATDEGRAAFERNMNLMDWQRTPAVPAGSVITIKKEPNPERFELLCQQLAFASILREMTMFLKAFNIDNTKELA